MSETNEPDTSQVNETTWICTNCNTEFNSKSTYYNHRKICDTFFHKSIYKNCVCGESFFSKTSFFVHKRHCEENKNIFKKNVNKSCDCGKAFHSRSAFYSHKRLGSCKNIKENVTRVKTVFKVCECKKSFFSKASYSSHKKWCTVVNENDESLPEENYVCQDDINCSFSCSKQLDFLDHIKIIHSIDSCWEDKTFQTYEDFLIWKEKMEKETKSFYVASRTSASQRTVEHKRFYYFKCDRSYELETETGGKKMSSSNSVKNKGCCPSQIVAKVLHNDEVVITFWKTHYGHESDAGDLSLSKKAKQLTAELSAQGISYDGLINDIRGTDKLDPQEMKKRYFKIIKSAYACEINKVMNSKECIFEWIGKCCKVEEVPVLSCQLENFGCEGGKFVLIMMTEFQKHVFLSSSKSIVSVDSFSHADNHYLITVSVIDEFKTSFPVVYCITNKIQRMVVMTLFLCIKESIGTLSPDYLMSSHNPVVYESWVEVMNNTPIWLWGHWHVKERAKRYYKLKNSSLRHELLDTLLVILHCKNPEAFKCLFKNYVDKLLSDKNTEKLGKWVSKNLGNDTDKWAHCYWSGFDWEANLQLEMLHSVLYTCNAISWHKGLFAFIFVLFKVLQHKINDTFVKAADDEKLSLVLNAISDCHKKSISIFPNQICSLSENLWRIEDSGYVYVSRSADKCLDDCELKCMPCNICIHQFCCSCVNFLIDVNLCTHIHAVAFDNIPVSKEPHLLSNEDICFKMTPLTNTNESNSISAESVVLQATKLCEMVQSNQLKQDSLQRITRYLNISLKVAQRDTNETGAGNNAAHGEMN